VLIHAAGSGVGLAAVQLVRTLGGVPYGTSRTPQKIEVARGVGLEDGVALPSGPAGLTDVVASWTGQRGVDIILDLVGGAYVGPGVEALALKGRMMLVGTVAGSQATIDVRRVLGRRLTLKGTVLRARPRQEKAEVTEAFSREVVPLLANGRLRPVIDGIYPLAEIVGAHRRMESNETVGKVVIDLS
jgi:NADPH:quinone reductase-like Zn-dependent oxidoreductase